MNLYNMLSRQSEPFTVEEEPITVYVCGITPYATTHLGHAFTYVSYDVLIRYLEFLGYDLRYVQNVTDIDDDILREARRVGDDWQLVGNRWTAHFIRDMQALNVRPPDYYPRATDVISGMLTTVQKLLQVGVAYSAGGSVYFEVDTWPDFGKLSGIPRDQMLAVANERGNYPDDPNKRDPLDFVLWQAHQPGEPAWESPWGPGRPGWHIECSTMAERYLEGRIDIHGGGSDLLFPHHECEIAQAEAAAGKQPFVRFWLHTAMVRHEGEKMSKSLGNLVMVHDLLKNWAPDALRLYMSRHHYREPWEHSEDELAQSHLLLEKLCAAIAVGAGGGEPLDAAPAREAFVAALDNDLDTPLALAVMERLAEEILTGGQTGQDVRVAQQALREMGSVFGLQMDASGPEERVLHGWQRHMERFTT